MASREEILERQVAALQQRNQELQQEMILRAFPTFSEFLDAVENMVRGAKQGDSSAKAALAKLNRALDGARDAASALEVIRS